MKQKHAHCLTAGVWRSAAAAALQAGAAVICSTAPPSKALHNHRLQHCMLCKLPDGCSAALPGCCFSCLLFAHSMLAAERLQSKLAQLVLAPKRLLAVGWCASLLRACVLTPPCRCKLISMLHYAMLHYAMLQ